MKTIIKNFARSLGIVAMLSCVSAAIAADDPIAASLEKSFVWAPADIAPPGKQIYAVFRKTFDLTAVPRQARLHIFADSRYLLWVNGHFVEQGPCRFDPRRPEYDSHDVAALLKPGRNAIAVLVHSYAIGSFPKHEQCARMMDHAPGLTARLDLVMADGERKTIATDAGWKLNARTRYQPSLGSYTSVPDNIDARLDDGDWTAADYDDARWTRAAAIDGRAWGAIHARSIPMLRQTALDPPTLVEPAGGSMPLELKAGQQAVFDLGFEAQTYAILDFEADAGSEFQLLHCPLYRQSGNRPTTCQMLGTPIGDRYIARAGRQTYMTGDTWGGRYLALIVRSGRVRLQKIAAVERAYPFNRVGRFDCDDKTLNQIWQLGVRTVEVCSEDAHVDCADRERAQWMADGYRMGWPVACAVLAGPGEDASRPRYADSRLLRNMLRHVALSQLPDGRLQPMRPSSYPLDGRHGVIDDYSCLWVQAVREYYEVTGDKAFVAEVWPVAVKTLDYFLGRRTERGLANAEEFIYFRNPLAYRVCEGASINSFIKGSLGDGVRLAQLVGDGTAAKRFAAAERALAAAVNRQLWDESAGAYSGGIVDGRKTPPTAHAALIALYYDVVPPERRERTLAFLNKHLDQENPFPYTCRYYFDVLARENTPESDRRALDFIRRRWTHMTRYETGTSSEDWNGGSFVHESGASPSYFLSVYVLGVRTEGPRESRRLVIQPRLGDLKRAEGVTLCEFGPVAVSWKKSDDGRALSFDLEIPAGAKAVVYVPRMSDNASLTVDGREIFQNGKPLGDAARAEGRFLVVTLGEGKHAGTSR